MLSGSSDKGPGSGEGWRSAGDTDLVASLVLPRPGPGLRRFLVALRCSVAWGRGQWLESVLQTAGSWGRGGNDRPSSARPAGGTNARTGWWAQGRTQIWDEMTFPNEGAQVKGGVWAGRWERGAAWFGDKTLSRWFPAFVWPRPPEHPNIRMPL